MRKVLLSALVAAVLVVLLASAQGTAALWRGEVQSQAGIVKTGSLSMAVGHGTASSQDYAFKELNTATLQPGSTVQAPLTISNTGTTPLGYTLGGARAVTPTPGASNTALAAAVELWVQAKVDPASCQTGQTGVGETLYRGPVQGAATFAQLRELPAAAAETLCLSIKLPAAAPQAAAGGAVELIFTWRGEQL